MSTLDEVMKDFNKKFKEELVHTGVAKYDYDRIPFTSPRLNYMTFGGLPEGKLIEFFGEEHGGKTTTALDIVANYQNKYPDRRVMYLDAENTLDVVWASKLGVDVDNLIIVNPTAQGAEELFQFTLNMIDTGEIGLVVIDSLGVMVSKQAMDKSVEEKTYGGIAMALTNFSEKAEGLCKRHKCTVLGINQERDDLGNPYGGKKTTGGRAWKHNCSVRLEFRKGQYFDANGNGLNRSAENPAGNQVLVAMVKNKTCPPTRRTGYYSLRYDIGIDYIADLIEVGIKYDIILKSGGWYDLVDVTTGEKLNTSKIQGTSKLRTLLETDLDLLKKIEQQIDAKINE